MLLELTPSKAADGLVPHPPLSVSMGGSNLGPFGVQLSLWDAALVENLQVSTNGFSGAILPAGIGCTSHWK
jgi:hypothetical protein